MGWWDSTDPRERVAGWFATPDSQYRGITLALWELVVVFYVLGDTGLTTIVLELGGHEANTVARMFVSALGYPGLVVQKVVTVLVLLLLWRHYPTFGVSSPDPWRLIVPAIPVLRGIQLVAIHISNIAVLL
ncbi:MAG: hypothetical protein ABEH35_01320 [Haloarculaceae archaeon]